MTIDSGARQETKPWTSFTKLPDIPDWVSKAYIESYRGPHIGESEAPEVPQPVLASTWPSPPRW